MPDPLAWIDEAAGQWDRDGLRRSLHPLASSPPGRVVRDGRSLVNFGSNDYLGLAADRRVVDAARWAMEAYGWGAGASPLVTGWKEPHDALARDLADFEEVESVALFPTGYAANLGTVSSLAGMGDAVYLDRLAHASLVDGARLSRARIRVFPHNDAGRLGEILDHDRGRFRRSLIVTEGVFSMDGDRAPLDELVDMAERFGAMLLVDEAHATGVYGPDGRGAAAECGVDERVHVRVGTLSKALGSIGGFVAGSRRLVGWLVDRARPLVYSTAMPPAAATAAREALRIVREEPWRRERVREIGRRLRSELASAGFEVGPTDGPIVPVLFDHPVGAVAVADWLRDNGLLVPAIRPPTVQNGTSRLRISVSAAHSEEDLSSLLATLNLFS